MTEKELNQFSEKIDQAVKSSAPKVTPPPFYSVLQRIAQDNSKEKYEEFFSDNEPLLLPEIKPVKNKKHTAARIIGIAAAVVLCVGAGMTAGIILMSSKFAPQSDSTYYSPEDFETNAYESSDTNSSDGSSEDIVSDSDIPSHLGDVSSDIIYE